MKKVKDIFLRIAHIKALKYIVVTLLAVVLVGFVDEDSIWHHIKNKQYINELQEEIDHYTELNRKNKEQIDMLNRDPKAIQKIARERYFMKADDEDIFVMKGDDLDSKFVADDETAQ